MNNWIHNHIITKGTVFVLILFLVIAPLSPILTLSYASAEEEEDSSAYSAIEIEETVVVVNELLEDPSANIGAFIDLIPDYDEEDELPAETSDTEDTGTEDVEDVFEAPTETVQDGQEGEVEESDASVATENNTELDNVTNETATDVLDTPIDLSLQDALDQIDDLNLEGSYGPDEPIGPDDSPSKPTSPETPTPPSSNSSGGGSGVPSSNSALGRFLDAAQDLADNPPTTLEEIEEYRDEYYDEQTIDTEDTSATVEGQSSSYSEAGELEGDGEDGEEIDAEILGESAKLGEDETSIEASGDDTAVVSSSDDGDSTTVEDDQYLDVENELNGEVVTGENVINSEKSVLEASITTGNADANATQSTEGNTSNVSTGGGGGGWIQRLYGYRTDVSNSGDDNMLSATEEGFKELTIINRDKAFVSNVHDLMSLTGRNTINARQRFKDGGIDTGDASVKSSLLNIINTTTVDSQFLPVTLDLFDDFTGNINILELLFDAFGSNLDNEDTVTSEANAENTGDDSAVIASTQTSESLEFLDEKEGYIYNDQDLKAISGQNRITAGYKAKDTVIETGDARITQNLINFLNTTLFKSKVGVVVVNVFADWDGNFIVPDAKMFAENIADPEGVISGTSTAKAQNADDSLSSSLSVVNTNKTIINESVGGIKHDITINAVTGDNTTLFDKDGEDVNIDSGDVNALSNILTLANRNVVGTAFSQGFFNILGNWNGEVVGVDEDSYISGNENNFTIVSDASALSNGNNVATNATTLQDGVDDSVVVAESVIEKSVTINTKQEGIVVNRANLTGITGENDVVAYKGSNVDINTGDVEVANNMATFLNNTFSYSKGLIVALNVFGDWQGNVAYNEVQDLSIEISALTNGDSEELEIGDTVSYEVSAVNSGTEPTPATTADVTYDASAMRVIDADGGTVNGNTISYDVPAMESGESTIFNPELSVNAGVADDTEIETSARININDPIARNNHSYNRLRLGSRVPGTPGVPVNSRSDNNTSDSGNDGSTTTNNDQSSNTTVQNQDQDDETDNSETGPDTDNSSSGNNTGGGSNSYITSGGRSGLTVVKIVDNIGPYQPGDTVDYVITVQNSGDTIINDIVAYDVLYNESVGDMGDSWELETLDPGMTATIEYSLNIIDELPSGTYVNTAYASGFSDDNLVRSNEDTATIVIDNPNYTVPDANNSSSNGSGYSGSGGGGSSSEGISTTGTNTDVQELDASLLVEETIGETFEAVDSFSGGGLVLGDSDIVEPATEETSSELVTLSQEEKDALEEEIISQIQESASVTKTVVPVAYAAETPEGFDYDVKGSDDSRVVLADNAEYAVYPNFLYFDGVQEQTQAQSKYDFVALLINPLFWIVIVIALLAGYWSYRNKKRKARSWN